MDAIRHIFGTIETKRILVCPLNWGLGHATRCIPIIHQLIEMGHEVVVASDGHPLCILREEFRDLELIEWGSYPIRYSRRKSQIGAMIRNIVPIMAHIWKEHRHLKTLIRNYNFDFVLSDNRFGLYHPQVISVYMTHQIMIKMPDRLKGIEPLAYRMHRWIINRFDYCLIPDYAGVDNLSGDLSHKYPLPENAHFTGPLSRFTAKTFVPDYAYTYVVVVSGPEPQRTLFEQSQLNVCKLLPFKTLLVRGVPAEKTATRIEGNCTVVSHLSNSELASCMLGAEKIICRSGYSSLMDLYALGCLHKAECIPTPGQTEQEYLYKWLNTRKNSVSLQPV